MTFREQKDRSTPGSGDGFGASEALVFGMFLGVVLAGILLLVVSNSGLEWTWEYWGNSEGKFDRSVIFRNFGLLCLAVIALPLAIWRSWTGHKQSRTASKQAELAEKGLIIDRYQKGAQMLESDELSVRLAGIYALRELVWSDPNETYLLVLDLLFDFVRERSKTRRPDFNAVTNEANEIRFGPFPPDLQKALEAACSLRANIPDAYQMENEKNWLPDLKNAILTDAMLEDGYLAGAQLADANMSFAELTDVDLTAAQMTGVNLNCATLDGAILKGAVLGSAMMMRTNLEGANLDNSDLFGANFTEAFLQEASLCNAIAMNAIFESARLQSADLEHVFCFSTIFSGAKMNNASLVNAYLGNSSFFGADLTEANMEMANLTEADLSGAVLSDAILTDANLEGAVLDDVQLAGADLTGSTPTEQLAPGANN